MPLKATPSFKSTADREMALAQPGIGGLNLKDLEFEQNVNQSPYMLNMMYRNGSFSKRYGQEIYGTFENKIYAAEIFDGKLAVHSGTKMYYDGKEIASNLPEEKGLFAKFAQTLFYFSDKFYQYKKKDGVFTWGELEAYIPDVLINCAPAKDGYAGDTIDDYNILGLKFNESFHGDGTTKIYYVKGDDDNVIDWTVTPKITVDGEETTAFTVDSTNKAITFTTAPSKGVLNVVMTLTLKSSSMSEDRERLKKSKYCITFGGNNNSRLFLAGGGDSKYFWSESYDATYWPENNWAVLGNSEYDITGFGLQYNILVIFKADEIYSLSSYTQSSSTTLIEEDYGTEAFKAQLVNATVGCDAPGSIQLIDNKLTWLNSRLGLCTLVSTNIVDERNVRPISRNIDRTNNLGVKGILDYTEDLESIRSVDYDSKYFLVFPESGMCFMWDYAISPYYYTSSKETDTKILDFFLFDNFYVGQFIKIGQDLVYVNSNSSFNKNLIKLNNTFEDLDFNGDGENDAIKSYYMTPYLQFNAVNYLKTVKNIYVQVRGDTSSVIDMWYYTDESLDPEQEPESIRIGGRIWSKFGWDNFQWLSVNHAKTFRRKCSLKKIEMCAFYFENNDVGRDMSISHIALQYQIVKNIK